MANKMEMLTGGRGEIGFWQRLAAIERWWRHGPRQRQAPAGGGRLEETLMATARIGCGGGGSVVDWGWGAADGVRRGAAALWEAAARPEVACLAGGEQLETEERARGSASRWEWLCGGRRGGRSGCRGGAWHGGGSAARRRP
uniref:Uncharacterized protein n=1 Tax=Oryza sativa subsp. japonica TaxID=39947 RepID=Q6EPL1_ORYSJ|nr:hypothetical protein [Oryza sativa Japonica Group]